MNWGVKVKAGALQFVLFIAVVIAILLLTFVTLSYSHAFFGKKTSMLIQVVKKADLAAEYLLQANIAFNDTILLDLALDDPIKVKAIKTHWGIFEKYTIVTSFEKLKFSKHILVGGAIKTSAAALYLRDVNRPMIIVGNAKITGEAYLPKQGIRPGNIAGNSYFLPQLIYGQQKLSKQSLPELLPRVRAHIQSLSTYNFLEGAADILSLNQISKLEVTFNAPTKLIHDDVLVLSNIQITGNVVLQASQKIIVEPSAILKDVLLIAPEIIIKEGVSGTFQGFASKNIMVGKGCRLAYPSALVVVDNSGSALSKVEQKPNITFQENTIFNGVVMYLSKSEAQFFYPQIKIESNTEIIGEVYCEKALELEGLVTGCVSTSQFMALANGSIYQNHLYNGQINRPFLSDAYSGMLFNYEESKKSIVKWLY